MLKDIKSSLERFFFAPEVPFALALIRIVMPLVIMTMVLPRWPFVRELYSADGATAQLSMGYGIPQMLPELPGSFAVALFTLLVVTLLCAMAGWQTRLSLAIAFVLYTYFNMLDAISTLTKYSVITSHLLLLLCCSECSAIWSVDAWLKRRPGQPSLPPASAAWPRRLMQLLIGIVYFGAAITKMNTPTFLSGDQLQMWMLTHINFRHPLGELLSLYPVLLKAMAYVAVVWEITFVFLVWRPGWRPIMLATGVIFHFLTTLIFGLFIFPMTCYVVYLAFANEQDFLNMRQAARAWMARQSWLHADRWQQRLATWSAALGPAATWRPWTGVAYSAVLLLTMTSAIGLEHWQDPFGDRRPEGRFELVAANPEFVQRMLAPSEAIRDQDKFFAIDTGTMLIGDLLADRRRVFRHGETMIVQCHLVPPHEDMWIEFKLLDPQNRLVDRNGSVATRELFRLNFFHPISAALEPGDYSIVFETAGREVLRKRISVVGDSLTVAAH